MMKPITLLVSFLLSSPAVATFGDFPQQSSTTCSVDSDCPLVNCFVPPCPAAVCKDGTCDVESNPPNPECVLDNDCPALTCFAAPCDVNVCTNGLCVPTPPEADNLATPGESNPNVPQGGMSCSLDSDCPLVNCLVPPCPAAVCKAGSCDVEANPPNPECAQDSNCPTISCFSPPCDINVCLEGLCVLQKPKPETGGDGNNVGAGTPCGPSICYNGQACCNESCGHCGPICSEEYCFPVEDETEEIAQLTNDTSVLPCNSTSDCPMLACMGGPCHQYFCNETSSECLLVEKMPCDGTGTVPCDDVLSGNASSVEKTSLDEGEPKETGGEEPPKDEVEPTFVAQSKSARQTFLLEATIAMVASLLYFV